MEPRCRICLSSSSNASLSSLSQTNIFMLKSIYSSFTVLNATDIENLRDLKAYNNICSFCQTVLNLLYEFQQKVVRSERDLLQQISCLEGKVSKVQSSLPGLNLFNQSESDSGPEDTNRPEVDEDDYNNDTADPFDAVFVKSEVNSDDDVRSTSERVRKRCRLDPEPEQIPKTNQRDIYRCEHCSYRTLTKSSLAVHMKKHQRISRPKGTKASTDDIKWTAYLIATQSKDAERYTCTFCDREFTNKHVSINHVREIHFRDEIKSYKCKQCSFTTPRMFNLKRHKMCHQNNTSLVTDQQTAPPQSDESENEDTKRGKRNPNRSNKFIDCDSCLKTFRKQEHLERHISKNLCDIPIDEDLSRKSVVLLLNSIPGEKTTYCKLCEEEFQGKGSGLRHARKVHLRNFLKPFNCQDCTYSTVRKENFMGHLTSFHAYNYERANKVLTVVLEKRNQTDHMSVKVESESNDDGTKATNLNDKRKRMFLECESCMKTFRRPEHVERHNLAGLCDVTIDVDLSKGSVMQLLNTIPGQRVTFCKICDEEFQDCGPGLRHVRNVHLRNFLQPFKCRDCSYTTVRGNNFSEHLTGFHGYKHTKATKILNEVLAERNQTS